MALVFMLVALQGFGRHFTSHPATLLGRPRYSFLCLFFCGACGRTGEETWTVVQHRLAVRPESAPTQTSRDRCFARKQHIADGHRPLGIWLSSATE